MTYHEWLEFTWRYYVLNRYMRKGQALFNALARINPGLADKIRDTPLDPTYTDERIADFLAAVKRKWDE